MLGPNHRKTAESAEMALAKSALAIAAAMIATPVWAEGPILRNWPGNCSNSARSFSCPRPQLFTRRCRRTSRIRASKSTRRQIPPGRPQPARRLRASHKSLKSLISVICIGRYFSASRDRDWRRRKAAVWPLHPPRRRLRARHRFAAAPRRDWSRRRRNQDYP